MVELLGPLGNTGSGCPTVLRQEEIAAPCCLVLLKGTTIFQSSRLGQFLDWLNLGLLTLEVGLIAQLIHSNEVQPYVLNLGEE